MSSGYLQLSIDKTYILFQQKQLHQKEADKVSNNNGVMQLSFQMALEYLSTYSPVYPYSVNILASTNRSVISHVFLPKNMICHFKLHLNMIYFAVKWFLSLIFVSVSLVLHRSWWTKKFKSIKLIRKLYTGVKEEVICIPRARYNVLIVLNLRMQITWSWPNDQWKCMTEQ